MVDDETTTEAINQLRKALSADDTEEKDYHVRQALQLLEVDDVS